MSIKNRLLRTVRLFFSLLLVMSFVMTPVVRADGGKIDLARDGNGDGISDELAQMVQQISTAPDTQTAARDMLARLPYSAETLALQSQAANIMKQMEAGVDDATEIRLNGQLQDIAQKMMADPNYAKVKQNLDALLVTGPQGIATNSNGVPAITGVSWSSLKRGHIMLVRSGWLPWTQFVYAMWYTHAGTFDGSSRVYESNPDGVRLKPLSDWQGSGRYVGLAYDNKRNESDIRSALDWAKKKWKTDGTTPYNYNFANKTTDSKLYCSQLVWKIHGNKGVDLDSNHWQYIAYVTALWGTGGTAIAYSAVAPDEIALDSDVTIYTKGWN